VLKARRVEIQPMEKLPWHIRVGTLVLVVVAVGVVVGVSLLSVVAVPALFGSGFGCN